MQCNEFFRLKVELEDVRFRGMCCVRGVIELWMHEELAVSCFFFVRLDAFRGGGEDVITVDHVEFRASIRVCPKLISPRNCVRMNGPRPHFHAAHDFHHVSVDDSHIGIRLVALSNKRFAIMIFHNRLHHAQRFRIDEGNHSFSERRKHSTRRVREMLMSISHSMHATRRTQHSDQHTHSRRSTCWNTIRHSHPLSLSLSLSFRYNNSLVSTTHSYALLLFLLAASLSLSALAGIRFDT